MKAGALYRGGQPVVDTVWLADGWWDRLRGLLGRNPLAPGQGLLLSPCDGVHTCWMGYPLDVLFLDRAGRVLGWRERVRPWRACRQSGARSTLELCAGGVAALHPVLGEHLRWRTATPPAAGPSARRWLRRGHKTSTSGREPHE